MPANRPPAFGPGQRRPQAAGHGIRTYRLACGPDAVPPPTVGRGRHSARPSLRRVRLQIGQRLAKSGPALCWVVWPSPGFWLVWPSPGGEVSAKTSASVTASGVQWAGARTAPRRARQRRLRRARPGHRRPHLRQRRAPTPAPHHRHRPGRIPRRHGRHHAGRVHRCQLHHRTPAASAGRRAALVTPTGPSKTGTATSPTASQPLPKRCNVPAPAQPSKRCATVQAALLGTARHDDDVCLLAVRLTG